MQKVLQENRWWTKYFWSCELSHFFLLLSEHTPSSAEDLYYCQKPRRLFLFFSCSCLSAASLRIVWLWSRTTEMCPCPLPALSEPSLEAFQQILLRRGLPVSLALISPSFFFKQLWRQTVSLLNRYFQSGAAGARWVCLQTRLLCFCRFSESLLSIGFDCYSRVQSDTSVLYHQPPVCCVSVILYMKYAQLVLQLDAGTLNRPLGP